MKYVVLTTNDTAKNEVHVWDGKVYDEMTDAAATEIHAKEQVKRLAEENPTDEYYTTMKIWTARVDWYE